MADAFDENKLFYKSEIIEISLLKKHPENYRTHGNDQLDHIAESIRKNGIYRNIVVAIDNTILAGHGVVQACQEKLGLTRVPIIRLNLESTDPRALKVLTGDNEIGKLAEVDDRKLSEVLRTIAKAESIGLLGTGFDEKQLANLVYVTRHADEIKDFNAANEWIGLPTYDIQDESLGKEPILVIAFANYEDREKFVETFGLKIRDTRGDRKWSTIWPYKERNDLKSVKFEDATI